MWTAWFAVLGFLHVLSMLARDRLRQLNTALAFHPKDHALVVSLVVLVLLANLAWALLCVLTVYDVSLSIMFLLLFECFVLFVRTLQTLVCACSPLLPCRAPLPPLARAVGGVCDGGIAR